MLAKHLAPQDAAAHLRVRLVCETDSAPGQRPSSWHFCSDSRKIGQDEKRRKAERRGTRCAPSLAILAISVQQRGGRLQLHVEARMSELSCPRTLTSLRPPSARPVVYAISRDGHSNATASFHCGDSVRCCAASNNACHRRVTTWCSMHQR